MYLLFYELDLYVGFLRGHALLIVLEPASSVIPTLAHTVGLCTLKPSSSGMSQIYEDTGLYLFEILISEYALS